MGHHLARSTSVVLLQRWMVEQVIGGPLLLSLSGSYILFCALGIVPALVLSLLVLLPVKATLHYARPPCTALIIPILEMLSWISAAFESILVSLRVIGIC